MTPVSLTFLSVPPKSCVSAVAVTPRNKAAAITTPIECLMSFLLSCCARMHGSSNLFRRGVDRLTEALDDRVDCAIIDDERRRNRRVAAAESLRDYHQIRADPLLLACVQRACAAHAAHDLVENEQNAVAAAYLAHAPEIPGHRGNRTHGGADDGLGDKADDVFAAELADFALEFLRQAFAIGLSALVRAPLAVFVDRRDMVRLDQQRSERFALPFAASRRERAESDAVIALPPRNDISPLRLTAFDEILARQFERGLDRLRATANQKDVTHSLRRVRDELVRQFLRNFRGEEARMRIGEPVQLLVHGCQDIRMRMAETRHRRTTRGIDVFLALGVPDGDAPGARGDRVGLADLAMKDMGHVRDRRFELLGEVLALRNCLTPIGPSSLQ